MTVLTRGDSLTSVHNGRFSHQCATLLEEQVKLTHCLSFASETESTKSLSPKLNSAHMRFLSEAFHWVWFRAERFHKNFGYDKLTPLDSTVFPMTQRTEKELQKLLSLAPSSSFPSMSFASGHRNFLGVTNPGKVSLQGKDFDSLELGMNFYPSSCSPGT